MSANIKAERVEKSLQLGRLGKNIFFRREVVSTNDWAKELAELGASEGTVTVAGTQTGGRGRLGRTWISPKGGLWLSVILRPELCAVEAVKLVFVAGLAVAGVLHELYGLKAETKWPNDVLVNGRKVCGILTEMKTIGETVNYVIIGIGINANFKVGNNFPEELIMATTSLENELGKKVQLELLFGALLRKLEDIYEQFTREGFSSILDEWKRHAGFIGCPIEVRNRTEKFYGLALDVDQDGALILRLEDGKVKRVLMGDVSLR